MKPGIKIKGMWKKEFPEGRPKILLRARWPGQSPGQGRRTSTTVCSPEEKNHLREHLLVGVGAREVSVLFPGSIHQMTKEEGKGSEEDLQTDL